MSTSYLETGFRQLAERQLLELESKLKEAEDSIRRLDEERSQINAEVLALRSLLAIDSGQPIDEHVNSHPYAVDPRDAAIEVLREHGGKDMHYKLLAGEVMHRGGRLPSKSPATALNAIMNRDDRFVRPNRRGYYALREHHPDVKENAGRRNARG